MISNVFIGPIRWLFAQAGLVPFIYLPIVLVGIGFVGHIAAHFYLGKTSRHQICALFLIPLGILSGLLHVADPKQVAFGFYALWPFFFGICFGPFLLRKLVNFERGALLIWLCASGGVIFNALGSYPWEGFEYPVGGINVESSREWYSGDSSKRLAGFSRASFDAAIQIALTCCPAIALTNRLTVKIAIAALSIAAIFFTNAKGMLLSFVLMILLSMLNDQWLVRLKVPLFSSLLALGMCLPLVSWLIQYRFDITGIAANTTIYSFTDRIETMWPEALELLTHHGSLIIGRGFGGIGVAQSYFEPQLFNAADNVFVYCSVVGGLGMFPVAAAVLIKFMTRIDPDIRVERAGYLMMVLVLVYGLTANVFENAPMALALGILISWGLDESAFSKVRPSHNTALQSKVTL